MNWNVSRISILAGLAVALTGLVVAGCNQPTSEPKSADAMAENSESHSQLPPPPDLKTMVPPADGFDFPVGPPDAKKYYNAQGFQDNHHLGEDWNGNGGGNTDLGDPVFSVAIGIVHVAEDYGAGWGNVLRIYHNIGSKAEPKIIESLYAHLDTMLVQVGDTVQRGQQIGNIGDAHGAYWAHLHLEMRHNIELDLGGGYGEDTVGYLVPTKFIREHRPPIKN